MLDMISRRISFTRGSVLQTQELQKPILLGEVGIDRLSEVLFIVN